MLHQSPEAAREGAAPINLADEFQVFDMLPARCIGHFVSDVRAMPRLRPGEVAVVDTRRQPARSGDVVLMTFGNDYRSIHQTNYRKFGGYTRDERGRRRRFAWWIDPVERPRDRNSLEHRCAAGAPLQMSDGPYTRARLEAATVGRIIGVLTPTAAAVFRETNADVVPPSPPEGFEPARFCLDLEAIGGSVVVDITSDRPVSFTVPACFFDCSEDERRARDEEVARLTSLARHEGAKASVRRYAIGIAGHIRREHPTGNWKMAGVVAIDRAACAPAA